MAHMRITAGGYEAQCELCGAWRKIEAQQSPCDTYFSHYQAEFICCGVQQVATLTMEKDELDFH
jgi:hypothetical protein